MEHPLRRLAATALAASVLALLVWLTPLPAVAEDTSPGVQPLEKTADLVIEAASVTYLPELDLLLFEQRVQGRAGGTVPTARGAMHGAPVLGYVFPTTLAA